MNEIRIYSNRPYLLAVVRLDEDGNGKGVIHRSGKAVRFKWFKDDIVFEGSVGGEWSIYVDLKLESQHLVKGGVEVALHGMALTRPAS